MRTKNKLTREEVQSKAPAAPVEIFGGKVFNVPLLPFLIVYEADRKSIDKIEAIRTNGGNGSTNQEILTSAVNCLYSESEGQRMYGEEHDREEEEIKAGRAVTLDCQYQSPRPLIIEFDEQKITIGQNSVDFYEKLLALPLAVRLGLMNINYTEVSDYLDFFRAKDIAALVVLIKSRWYFKETGERAAFSDCFHDLKLTQRQVLRKCKLNTISAEMMKEIKTFYTSGEVYRKEDR